MPVSIEILEDARSVRLEASGAVSGEELVAASRSFFRSRMKEFARCRSWLSDYSAADLGGVQTSHVHRLAEIGVVVSKENPELVVAIVVAGDFPFGLARMWESLSDETGWETRVFRSEDEARRWLDESSSPESPTLAP